MTRQVFPISSIPSALLRRSHRCRSDQWLTIEPASARVRPRSRTIKAMNTSNSQAMIRSADRAALVDIVAAIRATSPLTQPARAEILRTEGASALIAAVFNDTLLDPHLEQARAQAAADLNDWVAAGYTVTSLLDDAYPVHLAGVHQAPALLFSQGQLIPDDNGVSVVGSRTPTGPERQAAADVATGLVAAGLTVVSGMASGIDTAAHEAALAAGGRTVALMGTGLDHTYPAENRGLRRRIEATGLVATQFFPDMTGSQKTFPMRNVTMSGYGRATIVIAAGEHSGTRHQARAAISHSRGLILTPAVAERTTWGRKLVDEGRARIAHSPAEAVDMARDIIAVAELGHELFA